MTISRRGGTSGQGLPDTTLSVALGSSWGLLRDLAANASSFQDLMSQAFGSAGSDRAAFLAATEGLRQQLLAGGDLGITFDLVSNETLRGGRAAFAANGLDGQFHILVNRDWLLTADHDAVVKVLIEEIGHAIDNTVNAGRDSLGDEGELFANLVTGTAMTDAQRALIEQDNDHATLRVDGQRIEVEYSIDGGAVTGAGDSYLNAAEVAGGLAITGISKLSGTGTAFLVGIFTGSAAISPIYWQKSASGVLPSDSTLVSMTISSTSLNGYSGPIYIRIYQGSSSGAGQSANITGGTTSFPNSSSFSVNSALGTTALSTANSTTATGQLALGVYTIDRTASAPTTLDLTTSSDTGASSTDNVTNDNTPAISGAGAENGATVTLYDTDGTTVLGTGVANASGVWTITTSGLSDGAHTLTATQTDKAGNVSAASTGLAITIDTSGPSALPAEPDLASASDSGTSNADNITNKTTPTFTGSGAVAGATVTLYDTNGTTVLGTVAADGAGAWSITSSTLSAGAHTITAKQTDTAGNSSPASPGLAVTIDTAATAPTGLDLAALSDSGTSSTDNITNKTTPVITGSAVEAGATVTLYDTNGTTVLGTAIADGTGAWSIVTSALTAGAHTLTAKQTDIAGNVSAASTGLSVTIDTTAAAPGTPNLATASDTGSSSTDNITNKTTPTITGTGAEAGATVTLYDTNGTTVLGTAVADGAGAWSIVTSTLSAGAHTLTAKQTDTAGNTGAASTGLSVTIDTTAAAPGTPDLATASDTGGSSTDNLTNKTTPTITGAGAEVGATVTLYDTDGTTVLGSAVADGTGAWSVTSSTLSAGAHTITAKQTDTAGNSSPASIGLAVTIDTAAAAPTGLDLATLSDSGASSTDNITNNATPIISGAGADAGATVTLYDTNGTTVLGTAIADGTGAWSVVTATLTAGAHTLTAKQTDNAGNVSAASTGLSVTIDTTAAAPGTPNLATASDTGSSSTDNITNKTTPTVTGTGAEAGATITLYDTNGTTVLGTAVADGAGAWSIVTSTLSAGAHTLTANQTDTAGNTSAASPGLLVTIDTTAAAPGTPDLATASDTGGSSTDNLTNKTTPTITGAGAEVGATVTLYDTDGTTVLGSAAADGTGAWSVVTSTLSSGAHTVTARQTDKAGNVSAASASLSITVDTTASAPTALDLAAVSDSGASSTDNITNNATPTISGAGADAGATVTLYDTNGTTVLGTAVADGAGAWSIVSSTLSSGVHTLTAKQTDNAGNVSAASAGLSVTIDTTAATPGTPDLATASDTGSSSTDNITNNTTPTITGAGADSGATVTLYDTNGTTVLGTAVADGAGSWSVVTTTLSEGAYTLTAKQVDLAGNASAASAGLSITIDTVAPTTPPSVPDLAAASDAGVSSTDNLTNKTTPTFTGTGAEAGATITLFDTDGTTILGTGVADGAGDWSVVTSTLSAGAHTVTAKQSDKAGNIGPASGGLVVTIDTTPPPTITGLDMVAASDSGLSSTDNITNHTSPTITGAGAEPGATVTLFDTDGTTVLGTAVADGAGAWSIVTTALSAGAHTLTAKQSDPAGNLSAASVGLAVTIDPTAAAPGQPDLATASDTGTSSTDNVTLQSTPTISGSGAEAGAAITVYDTDGITVLGTATADGAGAWSIISSVLSDGVHTVTAKQVDVAGNASVASAGLVLTIDTVAPTVPTSTPDLAAASDSGTFSDDNLTNKTTPSFTGSGATPGGKVFLYDTNGTTVLGSAIADGGGNWTIVSSTLASGAHTVTAKHADVAGNLGPASAGVVVTIDTTAPVAPNTPNLVSTSDSGLSTTDDITNDTTPNVNGAGAEVGATVTLYDTDGVTVLGTTTATASGTWVITSSALAQGVHTLRVKQTDLAGNTGVASAGLAVTIDTFAPAPTLLDIPAATDTGASNTDNITQITSHTISGAGADAGMTVTIYDTDGVTVLGTTVASGTGTWSFVTPVLTEGAHAITAKQTDIAGNLSAPSTPLDLVVDTTPPVSSPAPDLSPTSDTGSSNTDHVTNDTTPTITGNGAEVGATITLYDSDGTTVLGTALVDGAGNWSITTPVLTYGVHAFTMKQTDVAGNTGPASAPLAIFITDRADSPDLATASDSGTSNTDNVTSTAAMTITGGGATAGAKITLYDTDGATVVGTSTADGSGNWSITTSTLTNGSHSLTWTQDSGKASFGLDVTVDTVAVPPSVPDLPSAADSGTSSADNLTNVATPTMTGDTAEAGATVTLYDTDGTTVLGSTVADGAGLWSITTSTLADGAHTLTTKQTDIAGNTSGALTGLTITVDTTAPGAPGAPDLATASDTGVSTTDNLTTKTTPTFTGKGAESGATITLYDTDGTTVLGTATANTAGDWTIISRPLSQGAHTVTAKQTDKAGNTGVASSGLVVTIDTTTPDAPTVPDLVATSDSGASNSDNVTNATTPSIKGSGAEVGATVTLYEGATVLGSSVVNGTGVWIVSAVSKTLTAGAHVLTARQTDKAGNVSALSTPLTITVDSTAAALPIPDLSPISDTGTSATDNVTSVAAPMLSGAGAEAGATVTLYDTDGTTVLKTAVADAAGTWVMVSPTLSTGAHTLTTTQTDRAGNVSPASPGLVVTIDTSAPSTPTAPVLATASDTGVSNSDNLTSKTTPIFTGTGAEAAATITLYDTDRATVLGTGVADGTGAWSITSSTLIAGLHVVSIKQSDKAGNSSALSAPLAVTIDNVAATLAAPDMAVTSDTGPSSVDNLTNDATPTFTGIGAEPGATVTLYDTGGVTVLGTATVDASGAWSITSTALSNGAHTLTVKQTDLAGNVSAASSSLVVTIDVVDPSALIAPDLAIASDTGASSTDNLTNKTTPTLTGGAAEVGSIITLFDTDGTTALGTATVDGVGSWSIISSVLGAGQHTLTTRQTDRAGNVSDASSGLTITIDNAVAAPSGLDLLSASDTGASDTDNVTNKNTPTVTGEGAEVGATVTLYDTNGITVLGTGVADANGLWTITSSVLAAGAHTLTAKQTDLAGNISAASASVVVTVDVAATTPTALDMVVASDTGVSSADNLTGDVTPTIMGSSAEAGGTITLYDTDGTTALGSATVDTAGSWAITSSALAAGAHSLTAKQTDRAGNVSAASTALAITIDAVPATMPAPDLDAGSDTGSSDGDNITDITNALISGTGATAGQVVTLYDTNGSVVLGTTVAGAAGDWSIVTSTLSSGVHAVLARQGAVAISSELVFTVDTVAATPAAPDLDSPYDTGISATDNVTNVGLPVISGAGAERGATITLYDTDGTTELGTAVADTVGAWAIATTALTEGVHALTVKQTDIAGNVSAASAVLVVTVDSTVAAPSAPDLATASDSGGSSIDNHTNKSTPTITGGGAEAGATVALFDTDGVTVLGTAIADASGNWSIVSATLSTGTHTLTAKQTDKAGNLSVASTGLDITIDTAAPPALGAPDLATASDGGPNTADNITSATTPTFTGSGAEAGATVTLYDTNGTTVLGTATADAGGAWSITSSALTAGAHTITTKQTDIAGNVSGVSAGLLVTIDTSAVAPTAPDLANASDTGSSTTDNLTNRVTPTVTGMGAEFGATVTLYDTNGTTVLGTTTAGSTGAWTITTSTLSAGAHTLTAKQTDRAGNVSVASPGLTMTVDTTVATPSAPDLSATSDTGTLSTDNLTSKTTPTFTGTGGEVGATVTLYDTNGTTILGSATADAAGAWSITTSTMTNGLHVVSVRQTDKAGNVSASSATLAVTIDSSAVAPAVPDLTAASDTGSSSTDNITNNATPVVTGNKADAGASVTLYDTNGTTVLGTATADASGTWVITTSTLSDGVHTLTAKQTDAAGNISLASPGLAITIDTTAPAAPDAPDLVEVADTGSSNTDNVTKNSALALSGTGVEVGNTITVYDTDGVTVIGTAVGNASGEWGLTTTSLTNGTHTLTATQTDKSGNVSAASTGLTVTVDTVVGSTLNAPDLVAASDTGTSTTDNITKDATPTLGGGGAAAGSTITIFDTAAFSTTILGTTTADGSGNWSFTSGTLGDGVHVLTTTQTDLAGNVSATSPGLSVTIDTQIEAPQIVFLSLSSISGNVAEGLPVMLYDQGIAVGAGAIVFGTLWNAPISLGTGTHVLTADTTDTAGNVSTSTAPISVILGTTGAETLVGTAGADWMVGDKGSDTYTVNHASDIAQEEIGEGTDTVNASVGYTLPTGSEIEFLAAVDPGSVGLALTGNAFVNTVIGAGGADTLAGGGSADTLTGNGGADIFKMLDLSDSTTSGFDTITDFSIAGGDRIDLAVIDADTVTTGDQAFSFLGTASFSGVAGQLRYGSSGGNTEVLGDVNGDSTADFKLLLTGSHTLTSSQFIL